MTNKNSNLNLKQFSRVGKVFSKNLTKAIQQNLEFDAMLETINTPNSLNK